MARVELNEKVLNRRGEVLSAQSVTVTNALTGTAATVYQAETGSSTHTQPLTTDSLGRVQGWVEEGSYELSVGGSTTYYEAVSGLTGGVYNVRSFGAQGDGTTDDTAAIQAALDAAAAAGGGVVYVPPGTYSVNSTTHGASGSQSGLRLYGTNVTLRGAGRRVSRLVVTNAATSGWSATCIGMGGATKGSGTEYAQGGTLNFYGQSVYTINALVKSGSQTVTCSTAAQAANFEAGDAIFIRTGQTISGSYQADSEVNEVKSVDVGTGVITLTRPTVKPYQQEYYVTGTSGRSTTSVTANAAPLGVSKVTACVARNLAIEKLGIEVPTGDGAAAEDNQTCVAGSQTIGFRLEGCELRGARMLSTGGIRDAVIRNNVGFQKGQGSNGTRYLLGSTSTGSSDWLVTGNIQYADKVGTLELHEGTANIRVIGNSFLNGADSALANGTVSVRSRCYGLEISHNAFNNYSTHSSGTGIYADGDCSPDTFAEAGGRIESNDFRGNGGGGAAVAFPGSGWVVVGNRSQSGQNAGAYEDGNTYGKSFAGRTYTMAGVVKHDNQSVSLGVLPQQSYIVNVHMFLRTAFNSSGTDLLKVGTPYGSDWGRWEAGVDCSVAAPTLLTWSGSTSTTRRNSNVAREVWIYYVNGGSEPTTGEALVVVEYARTPVVTT